MGLTLDDYIAMLVIFVVCVLFILRQLKNSTKTDPVFHCPVYKKDGCSHVDGMMCDFPYCHVLKDYVANHEGRLIENIVNSIVDHDCDFEMTFAYEYRRNSDYKCINCGRIVNISYDAGREETEKEYLDRKFKGRCNQVRSAI
jgi:DNA-directed RNA polymerase subunit RPC12/RpoP